MARRPERRPKQRAWQRMVKGPMNPAYRKALWPNGIPPGIRVEVFANDLYQATVEHWENGWAYITVKRNDRHVIRDWRHLQSIKNETVGPEREAFEMFPAESRLMDTTNQYHLFVLPEGEAWPLGQTQRETLSAAEVRVANQLSGGKGRQRDWQSGLSTGPSTEEA